MADTFTHDPDATLDYSFDWSAWLAEGETIQGAVWTVSPADGITKGVEVIGADGVCTVWLSGGTLRQTFQVSCRVTTSLGRVDERSFRLVIRDR